MQKLLIVVLILLSAINCKSQETVNQFNLDEPIAVVKNKIGYTYYQNNVQLSLKRTLDMISNNEEAYKCAKRAKNIGTTATVFSWIGGFCFGYGIGDLLYYGPDRLTWIMFGSGVISLSIALPLAFTAEKNFYKGVSIYNESLEMEKQNINIEFGMTPNGIGLVLNF